MNAPMKIHFHARGVALVRGRVEFRVAELRQRCRPVVAAAAHGNPTAAFAFRHARHRQTGLGQGCQRTWAGLRRAVLATVHVTHATRAHFRCTGFGHGTQHQRRRDRGRTLCHDRRIVVAQLLVTGATGHPPHGGTAFRRTNVGQHRPRLAGHAGGASRSGLAGLSDQATGRRTHHFAQAVEVLLNHGVGVDGTDVRAVRLRRVLEACRGGGRGVNGGGGQGVGEEQEE